jgi:hypothetical protein
VRFRRTRKGVVEGDPDEVETAVLRRCVEDLLVLLGEQDDEPADPLEAMLGLSGGDRELSDDPALARLLPDAYPDDDPEASREFRRYTEVDLVAGKRAHCSTVLATLAAGGPLRLDAEQAQAWLGCLNDLRLVLGTRLEVTEELDPDALDPDDPRTQALQVYGWLGWLQESLLACLMGRR